MFQNVIKFRSGFYGLQDAATGEIVNASLVKWDGQTGTFFPYDISFSHFEYYQTADKTIYYTDKNGENARLWCSGNRLNQHCHRLAQIKAR